MRSWLICALALLGPVIPAGLPQRSDPLQVTAVRFWSLDEVTRVAIETNGEFRFHSERLQGPDRIFFDLFGAKPPDGDKGTRVISVGDKFLKRIRVAETQRSVTRVVLDLETSADFTASQLANPDRLMIELRRATQPTVPFVPFVAPSAPPLTPVPEKVKLPDPPKIEEPKLLVTPPPAAPSRPEPVASPARPNSDGASSLIRALGLKVRRVVIDAGHGGADKGSTGRSGLMEKELVLDVAKRLGALVEAQMGSEVIYTRTDDSFVPLEARTALANEKKADLFLSLHANSSRYPAVTGVETFYLNFTSARDGLELAARENAASQKSIYELRDMIQKITLFDKVEESKEFAGRIQSALFGFEARSNPSSRNRGIKKAPFVVLIGASMPSVLAEIGFVSNGREEALLKRSEHRQRLAEALYRGVSKYADTLSHFQVARKETKALLD